MIINIHENALTTDTIEKGAAGYILTYYTYANEWGDRKHIIEGKNLDDVLAEYQDATHRLDDYQEYLAGDTGITTRELAYEVDYIEE